MRVTVLGACGAWPEAGSACSGFLVEQDRFRLLLDCGYATVPRLLTCISAADLDAVFISHGHPDHCADLSPLLRARALPAHPRGSPPPLPVYALPGALDAVLALDNPGLLADAYLLREFRAGADLAIGPFRATTCLLPHWIPNAGVRLEAAGQTVAYTGDTGPSAAVGDLARNADLLIADATFAGEVPADSRRYLTSAAQAGRQAADAGVRRLLLTHLWPGTDPALAAAEAASAFGGAVGVAVPGLVVDLP